MKSIVCSVAIALACQAASAQVLFFDNFDDGPDPAWGNELGNWVAPAGEYYEKVVVGQGSSSFVSKAAAKKKANK